MNSSKPMNDMVNQVTDTNVREALYLMANNLVSDTIELAEKLGGLQTICFNLIEWLRVQALYINRVSILIWWF